MAWSRRRAKCLRIPSCRQAAFESPGAAYPPPLIQKRFISDISHVETETLNLILDPPLFPKRRLCSAGGPKLLKWSRPGRGVKCA